MHGAAEKDFQRPAIFSPDVHEMRLIGTLGKGTNIQSPVFSRHFFERGRAPLTLGEKRKSIFHNT
jgi:hypothetical protein